MQVCLASSWLDLTKDECRTRRERKGLGKGSAWFFAFDSVLEGSHDTEGFTQFLLAVFSVAEQCQVS